MGKAALCIAAWVTLQAGAAAARCELPAPVTKDPMEAARYLHGSADIIVEGVVRELPRGDDTLFQRIEIEKYIKGKGPQAIDIWPGPPRPTRHDIIATSAWGRIEAASGARVVTALRRTPYGWTVGECDYQALAVPGVENALRDGRWVMLPRRATPRE